MRKIIIFSLMILLHKNIALAADATGRISGDDIYFSCGYINYAWGFAAHGFYINTKGEVYKYGRHKPVDIMQADAEFVGQIDLEELNEKVMLIAPASKGEIISKPRAKDAGTRSCSAYLRDISSDKGLTVSLGTVGISDVEKNNTSEEAQDLLSWLIEVKKKYVQPQNNRSERSP